MTGLQNKKIVISICCVLSLCVAGCGKTQISDTLRQCQTTCDQVINQYSPQVKSQCYKSCQDIEAMNTQQAPVNEKITSNADCQQVCTSTLFANATPQEQSKCQTSCQTSVKIASAQLSDCDDIENISDHTITKDACIMSKATAQKQADYCQYMQDNTMIGACYTTIANETKNPELCNKITNETEKTVCRSTINQ